MKKKIHIGIQTSANHDSSAYEAIALSTQPEKNSYEYFLTVLNMYVNK